MTETGSLIAEVRQLRADVPRLHAGVLVRHSWMKMFVKDLSTNPHTQYKVHMWGRDLLADQLPADLLPPIPPEPPI